jgi:protein-S-isoprenylcysteine O-methyltransferase Ste14
MRRFFLAALTHTPVLTLAALAIALGYIGVAGWGYGSPARMLADPARAGVCVALAALAAATPLCGCHTGPGRHRDAGNDWIFPILLLLGLTMGWVSGWTDRHGVLTIGAEPLRYAGLAVFIVGAGLRLAAMIAMGPRFTVWVAVQEDHQLQTTGLYRFVRHPSYTGAILTLLGWALTFRSLPGLILAASVIPLLASRAAAEERLLTAEFDREYNEYRRRSWRLLPWVY